MVYALDLFNTSSSSPLFIFQGPLLANIFNNTQNLLLPAKSVIAILLQSFSGWFILEEFGTDVSANPSSEFKQYCIRW